MLIDFPSGFKVEARKLQGQELITLAESAKNGGSDTVIARILQSCWQKTVDQGPYPFATPGESGVLWNRVLKADLLAGLIQLRVGSLPEGDRYTFPVQCEKCREPYDWTIGSLKNDLPVQRLSDAARAELLNGSGRFSATTLTGVGVTYKLLTSEDDEPLKKLMKLLERKKLTVVEALAVQITTIEGVSDAPNDLRKRHRWLAGRDYDELLDLRAQFDEHDCGIELEIRTTCKECGWGQDQQLPFGRTFFRPDSPKKVPTPTPSTTPSTSSEPSSPA